MPFDACGRDWERTDPYRGEDDTDVACPWISLVEYVIAWSFLMAAGATFYWVLMM